MKKLFITIITSLLGVLILGLNTTPVSATIVGISPANLDNDHLKPGSEYAKQFRFSLSELEQDMVVNIDIESEEIYDWISLDTERQFIYKKDQTHKDFKVTIKVPENARHKKYSGIMRVNAQGVNSSKEMASLVGGARVDINVDVNNRDYQEFKITAAELIIDEDRSSLTIKAKVRNNGNIESKIDKFYLTVQDLSEVQLLTLEQTESDSVPPFSDKEISIKFTNPLRKGQYVTIFKAEKNDEIIYENKLVLNLDFDGTGVLKQSEIKFEVNDYVALILGTVICIGTLIFIARKLRKNFNKGSIIYAILLALPIIILIVFYGYYASMLINSNNKIKVYNSTVLNDSNKNIKTQEAPVYGYVNKTTIKFNMDGKLYKEMNEKSEVKVVTKAGELYKILEEKNGWFKIELQNSEFAYIKKLENN